jgi:hypothetical protein
MRGVWRACALCEAAPITGGTFILVIKGVHLGRVYGHIGQIRKITEILENWHLDGPWGGAERGGLGIKKQSTKGFRLLGHWGVVWGGAIQGPNRGCF